MNGPNRSASVILCAALALGVTNATAITASAELVRTQQAAACRAVNVVGQTIHAARAALRQNGCVPGNAKDGRHYVVRTVCAPEADFGRIVKQQPRLQVLGPRQVLQLWSGIRGTGPGGACTDLPEPDNDKFDGRYSGTFTVEKSTNALEYPVGGTLTGVTFTVSGTKISGEVAGSLNAAGISNDARYAIGDTQCTLGQGATMTFGNGSANAASVTCRDGTDVVTGRFVAWAQ